MARVGNLFHALSSDSTHVRVLLWRVSNRCSAVQCVVSRISDHEVYSFLFLFVIRAAEFGVLDMFLPSRFCALQNKNCLRANESVLISFSQNRKADIIKQGLLTITSDCECNPVSVLLVFDRRKKIAWKDLEALGKYLYEFAAAIIIVVLVWQAGGSKIGRHGDALPVAVHLIVVLKYVEKCLESGMKSDFAEAVWNRFKMDCVELPTILSIVEQRGLVRDTANHCYKDKAETISIVED